MTINKSNNYYSATSNLNAVCVCLSLAVCVPKHNVYGALSVCVFLLYVGYDKAGTAEFSTQEQGRKWCMDNSVFRSSGTHSESSRLNQYSLKLSHVPPSHILLRGSAVRADPF